MLEPRLISDDINKIKKFEALSSLIKLYDKWNKILKK
jgi:hypothetical protein